MIEKYYKNEIMKNTHYPLNYEIQKNKVNKNKNYVTKKELDSNKIIPIIQTLQSPNLANPAIIETLDVLNEISKEFFFSNYEILDHSGLFNILFSFSFEYNDIVINYKSLALLNKFVESPVIWYANVLYDMGIIQFLGNSLLSNSFLITKNSLKLLITLSQINLCLAQDILSTIKCKCLLNIFQKHNENKLKDYILSLIYFLSRCDMNEMETSFIHLITKCIDYFDIQAKIPHKLEILMKIIYSIQFFIKNQICAMAIINNTKIVNFLNKAINFPCSFNDVNLDQFQDRQGEVIEPTINCICMIHYYCDILINGFDYKTLILFTSSNNQNLVDVSLNTLENILTHPVLDEIFITQYDVLQALFLASAIGSYSTKSQVANALCNAIISSSESSRKNIIEEGAIHELIDFLEVDEPELLIKIIWSLKILLSVEGEESNIAFREFTTYYDSSLFEELLNSDNQKLQETVNSFFDSFPNLLRNIS